MDIIIFIIILVILVLVHELGHFSVAKYFGIRVDEFAIGFRPKLFSFRRGETTYSLNALPLGGFVKIFGENPNSQVLARQDLGRNFSSKPRHIQASVLVAGIVANLLFAWFLFSLGYVIGVPASIEGAHGANIKNPELTVESVVSKSPAEISGIQVGDKILSLETADAELLGSTGVESVRNFIAGSDKVTFKLRRDGEVLTIPVIPQEGIVSDRKAVGVGFDMIGTLRLPPHEAVYSGFKLTAKVTGLTASGLVGFFKDALFGEAKMAEVAGPVGIIGLVRDASGLGLGNLILFTALISINLAILNLMPIPALDGGRLLFVAIEAIIRRALNPRFVNAVNLCGFALLILLMIFVTYNDVLRLF